MLYLYAVQLPFTGDVDHIYMEHECEGEKANFQLQGIGLKSQGLLCYYAIVE